MNDTTPLAEEIAHFDESLADWLTKYPGRVVLVKGKELIGVFDTESDAISEGARQFGLESFLVRRVVKTPDEIKIPALTLGILSADPSSSIRATSSSKS